MSNLIISTASAAGTLALFLTSLLSSTSSSSIASAASSTPTIGTGTFGNGWEDPESFRFLNVFEPYHTSVPDICSFGRCKTALTGELAFEGRMTPTLRNVQKAYDTMISNATNRESACMAEGGFNFTSTELRSAADEYYFKCYLDSKCIPNQATYGILWLFQYYNAGGFDALRYACEGFFSCAMSETTRNDSYQQCLAWNGDNTSAPSSSSSTAGHCNVTGYCQGAKWTEVVNTTLPAYKPPAKKNYFSWYQFIEMIIFIVFAFALVFTLGFGIYVLYKRRQYRATYLRLLEQGIMESRLWALASDSDDDDEQHPLVPVFDIHKPGPPPLSSFSSSSASSSSRSTPSPSSQPSRNASPALTNTRRRHSTDSVEEDVVDIDITATYIATETTIATPTPNPTPAGPTVTDFSHDYDQLNINSSHDLLLLGHHNSNSGGSRNNNNTHAHQQQQQQQNLSQRSANDHRSLRSYGTTHESPPLPSVASVSAPTSEFFTSATSAAAAAAPSPSVSSKNNNNIRSQEGKTMNNSSTEDEEEVGEGTCIICGKDTRERGSQRYLLLPCRHEWCGCCGDGANYSSSKGITSAAIVNLQKQVTQCNKKYKCGSRNNNNNNSATAKSIFSRFKSAVGAAGPAGGADMNVKSAADFQPFHDLSTPVDLLKFALAANANVVPVEIDAPIESTSSTSPPPSAAASRRPRERNNNSNKVTVSTCACTCCGTPVQAIVNIGELYMDLDGELSSRATSAASSSRSFVERSHLKSSRSSSSGATNRSKLNVKVDSTSASFALPPPDHVVDDDVAKGDEEEEGGAAQLPPMNSTSSTASLTPSLTFAAAAAAEAEVTPSDIVIPQQQHAEKEVDGGEEAFDDDIDENHLLLHVQMKAAGEGGRSTTPPDVLHFTATNIPEEEEVETAQVDVKQHSTPNSSNSNSGKQPVANKPKRKSRLPPVPECTICWSNPCNVVTLPCGHLATCSTCSESLRKPITRTNEETNTTETSATCPLCRASMRGLVVLTEDQVESAIKGAVRRRQRGSGGGEGL